MMWGMSSGYTPLGFNRQTTGSNVNTWGDTLNDEVIALVDEAIRGMASFTLSGTVTLTSTNGTSNQARCAVLNVTGGTGGTITIPSISKIYAVWNQSTGDVVVSTGGATTATVGSGDLALVACDGTKVRPLMIGGLGIRAYIDEQAFAALEGDLPGQTGNAGKFLSTDGAVAGWAEPATTNITATGAQTAALSATNKVVTPDSLGDALAFVDDGNISGAYAPNVASGPNHKAVLSGNINLGNLTGAREGQTFYLRLKQDGTGSRLLSSIGTGYKFDGDITPTLTTTAGRVDAISGIVVDTVTPRYDCVFIKGMAA